MSTRSTIAYKQGKWHLYSDIMEDDAIFLEVTHTTHTGRTITEEIEIPWEVAEALHETVENRRTYEKQLRDPEWLQVQIDAEKQRLQESLELKGRGFKEFLIYRSENTIRFYQEKLDELQAKRENNDV